MDQIIKYSYSKAIIICSEFILGDPYGNYVLQCLIEKSPPRSPMVDAICDQLCVVDAVADGKLVQQASEEEAVQIRDSLTDKKVKLLQAVCVSQFSSKAVEKILTRASAGKAAVLCAVLSHPEILGTMITSQYGNYIVQTALVVSSACFSRVVQECQQAQQNQIENQQKQQPHQQHLSLSPQQETPWQGVAKSSLPAEAQNFAVFVRSVTKFLPLIKSLNYAAKIEIKLEQAIRQYNYLVLGQ